MIKFQVFKRFTSEVAFTAEIDASESTSQYVKLGLAVKWAIKAGANLRSADLGGADLRSANLRSADLYGADLRSADLYGADLGGADLRSANLRSADLYGANLYGADLYGADLGGDQWIIQGAVRSDGYAFFLQKLKDDKEPMVKAGCRHFTIAQAEKHWTATRAGQPLLAETETIIRSMIELARIRKLMPAAIEIKEAA